MKARIGLLILGWLFLAVAGTRQGHSEEVALAWTGETWTSLTIKVAVDKGFFDREGLKAKLITIRSTELILKALLLGELDYATPLPSMGAAAFRGLPVKIVGVLVKGTGYAIISKPEIKSVRELAGSKIAISSFGAASDFAAYTLLSKHGLDPNKDVIMLNVGGTASRFAALVGGAVDATVVSSPFEYKAEKQGFRTLVSVQELAGIVRLPNAGIAVTQTKIRANPEQIVRVLRALRAATLFVQREPKQTISILESFLKLDPTAAERFYQMYKDQFPLEMKAPDEVLDEFKAMAGFRLRIKEKPFADVVSIRDWSFVEKIK